jgi:hypothetical protein
MFGTDMRNPLFEYLPQPIVVSVGWMVVAATVLALVVLTFRDFGTTAKAARRRVAIFATSMVAVTHGVSRAFAANSVITTVALFLSILIASICVFMLVRWAMQAARHRRVKTTGGLTVTVVATVLVITQACQLLLAPGGAVWQFLNDAVLQLTNTLFVLLCMYVLLVLVMFLVQQVKRLMARRAQRRAEAEAAAATPAA